MKSVLFKLGRLMSMRMLAIGLTFVQTIVMTRVFGSEVFGLLSFALSISALLVLMLSAGLDQVLMRDIARFGPATAPRTQRWRDIWHMIAWVVVPATLGCVLVGAMLMLTTGMGGSYSTTLLAMFVLLPFVLGRKYVEAISLGTKKVVRSIFGSQIVYPLLMIAGGLAIWFSGAGATARTASYTYVFAGIGSMIASVLLIRGTLSEMRAASKETAAVVEGHSPSPRALLTSGMHFSVVSLGFLLGQHIDVLITGVIAGPEAAALVRIAGRVAEMAGMMRAIILLQYKPHLAEAYGKGDTAGLQAHATFMVRIFVFTGVPITLGLWIFADEVMGVFGPEFVDAAWAMRIYVAGVLVMLLLGPGNAVLSLCDNEHIASRNLLISTVIQIVLDLLLIPKFGIIGCACANFIAMSYLAVASLLMTRKKVGIETSIISIFLGKTK